jgi:hypothetical protein
MDDEGNVYARSFRPSASDLASLVPVSEPVEAGDVLVIDPESVGMLSLARTQDDGGVFGIVAAEPGVVLGDRPLSLPDPAAGADPHDPVGPSNDKPTSAAPDTAVRVPVALSGIALCKVDAGYGAIRPGDLLTTSPTTGHAMRAADPRPGTVLGKALEPLDAGTGRIKVLVMLR